MARLRWVAALLTIGELHAQTCLVLSAATAASNRTAVMELFLHSSAPNPPAALQWTFRYPASVIQSLIVNDGPMLASAGKTAICAGDDIAYTCLAVGNAKSVIADGLIAKVIARLVPGAPPAPVELVNALAASAGGYPIPICTSAPPRKTSRVSK